MIISTKIISIFAFKEARKRQFFICFVTNLLPAIRKAGFFITDIQYITKVHYLMRVISGIYKRRRFDVPRTFKARPTTDFAKENLFNVLNNYIDFEERITALDLFAGTGSISIELVSRGCDRVISIEKDPAHHSFICKIMKEVQTDKCLPIRGDVFKFIKNGREQFDFIFADPPYALKELETIPELIFQNNLLKEGGLLVLEHGKDNNFEENPHFLERRVYGSVNFSLFR